MIMNVVNQKLTISYLVALTISCRTIQAKYGTSKRAEDCITALEYLPSYLSTDGTEVCLEIINEIEAFLKGFITPAIQTTEEPAAG